MLHRVQVRKSDPGVNRARGRCGPRYWGLALYVLMDVDTQTREILIWRDDQPLVVGFDGQSRPSRSSPLRFARRSSTYLRLGPGWVAWDAYREDGPYHSAGHFRVAPGVIGRMPDGASPRQRSTQLAGSSPISETTTLSIGPARDVVIAAHRHRCGRVPHPLTPLYTKPGRFFFEGGLFGYSNLEGTRILKVPKPSRNWLSVYVPGQLGPQRRPSIR